MKKKSDSKKSPETSLTDYDIYLLGEGKHLKSYEKLGAHVTTAGKKTGVNFTVWAPHAKSVSVVGEFNNWKPGEDKMQRVNHSGYWSRFIPGLKEGDIYKFAVKPKSGEAVFKSDPFSFRSELRPGNASIVHNFGSHKWNDKEWMSKRKKSKNPGTVYKTKPVSIYEVHPGSWKKDYDNKDFPNEWGYKNYRQLAHELVEYVKDMNYTHIELLPVMEHPLDISWGYQVVNYFAPTSRYGSPEDFMYFVDLFHQNGIGVILDWVPSHFPTDEHGLALFDGTHLYSYSNHKKGFHKDWGTYVFDYGKNEVKNFLISNALFWFENYHIDGMRVDAVASMLYLDYSRNEGEWEPNIYGGNENLEAIEFLKELNVSVHKKHKGAMMIAEESSSWQGVTRPIHLGGLGFDMKWNMGWMHDILAYFSMDPIYRKFHHGKLTFAIWYAFNENFLLPISHDEVVHLKKAVVEKMPYSKISGEDSILNDKDWQKFANLRLLFGFMFSHPGKKLNFMGNDIAQYKEWNSEVSLNWEVLEYEYNAKFHLYFRELNRLYCAYSAFHEDDFDSTGFRWLDFSDADNSVIAYVRFNKDNSQMLLFTFNMTPVLRENYLFGVPYKGYYKEILNSNAGEFGGTGTGNLGGVYSEGNPRFEFPNSIRVTLPPLAVNVYEWIKEENDNSEAEEVSGTIQETEIIKEEVLPDVLEKEIPAEDLDKIIESEENKLIEIANSETEEAKPPDDSITETEAVKEKKDDIAATGISDPEKKQGEITEEEMEDKLKEILNRIKKF